MMDAIRGSTEIPPMLLVTESSIRNTNQHKKETEVATTRIKEGVRSPPGPSSYDTLPEELLTHILKIARNPNTRLVSKNFTTATNRAEDELSKLLQQCLKEQAIAQFLEEPLPSDFFSQYPKKRYVELLETLHRKIVLVAHSSGIQKIDESPLEAYPSFFLSVEQMKNLVQAILDYNLCLFFHRLPLPPWNDIQNIKELIDCEEKATAIRAWMEQKKKALKSTPSLELAGTSLTYLPEEISTYFPNLKMVDLSDNKLSSISKNFGSSWTKLKNLDLANNQLQSLPQDFGTHWPLLEGLALENNQIETLPKKLPSNPHIFTTIPILCTVSQITSDIFVRGNGILVKGLEELEENESYFPLNEGDSIPLSSSNHARGKIAIAYQNLDEARLHFYLNDTLPELSGIRPLPQNQATALELSFE